jgi:hypothetical protein
MRTMTLLERGLSNGSVSVGALLDGATALVEAVDGRWIAVEVKLGHNRVDEGARNLLALRAKLSREANARCGGLLVLVSDSPTYVRPDGVLVSSVAVLGP